jgi:hypothetical protein
MNRKNELLDKLQAITAKPRPTEKQEPLSTNRYWLDDTIKKLPARYDKAKKHKDENGDYYIWIDRAYGSLYDSKMVQADGSEYLGKLYKKRRLVTSKDPLTGEKNNFYSACVSTADGRWFDNSGFPIEVPEKLEPEKQPDPEELELEKQRKLENAKNREAAILANLK